MMSDMRQFTATPTVEELEAELSATQENEQRLVDANKPLLARACRAEAEILRLRAVVDAVKYHKELMPKGVMKALAALEDSDDSNEGL
jgi:hypothetical protein